MMKRINNLIKVLIPTLIAMCGLSCSEQMEDEAFIKEQLSLVDPTLRTEDEAIDQAIAMRKELLGKKSVVTSRASEISVSKISLHSSRSSAHNLWVVNFPDSSGYVVLPENKAYGPLAITERGTLTSIDDIKNESIKDFYSRANELMGINPPTINPIDTTPMTTEFYYLDRDTSVCLTIKPRINVQWGAGMFESYYCENFSPGCVNVACAQVLSYFELPTSMAITYPDAPVSSIEIDWTQIKKHVKDTDMVQLICFCGAGYENHLVLANLIRQLGHTGGSRYTLNGTSGTRSGAQTILSTYLPSATVIYRDNTSRMTVDIEDGILIMFGIANSGVNNENHCFIIDGCDFLSYREVIYTWNGLIDSNGNHVLKFLRYGDTYSHRLYHINWGDCGVNNGYYAADVYNTNRIWRRDGETSSEISHDLDPLTMVYLKVCL